ncbi:hypothetical protein OROGR_015790 [Orobanche gracilis]
MAGKEKTQKHTYCNKHTHTRSHIQTTTMVAEGLGLGEVLVPMAMSNSAAGMQTQMEDCTAAISNGDLRRVALGRESLGYGSRIWVRFWDLNMGFGYGNSGLLRENVWFEFEIPAVFGVVSR